VVPAAPVRRAVDSLLDAPRSYQGRCIAYSTSPNDLVKPCVWNVHFGAADWVLRASELLGYRTTEARALARVALSWLTVAWQDPGTGYWPYSSAGGPPQDVGHQLWTAAAVDALQGSRDALALMLGRPYWRQQASRAPTVWTAAAMGSIALSDCRYASDPTVVRYAVPRDRAAVYTVQALAGQALAVLRTCFGTGRVTPAGKGVAVTPVPRGLG
jgi:hypothetical protein